MKTSLCILLALVCFAALANCQNGCPNICPLNFDPKCGYNGNCYKQFSNACDMSTTNCRSRRAFKQVDLTLCKQASSRGGRLRSC